MTAYLQAKLIGRVEVKGGFDMKIKIEKIKLDKSSLNLQAVWKKGMSKKKLEKSW